MNGTIKRKLEKRKIVLVKLIPLSEELEKLDKRKRKGQKTKMLMNGACRKMADLLMLLDEPEDPPMKNYLQMLADAGIQGEMTYAEMTAMYKRELYKIINLQT